MKNTPHFNLAIAKYRQFFKLLLINCLNVFYDIFFVITRSGI